MHVLLFSFSHSRKLVYPFSVPIGASYACQSDSTATIGDFSNPNRFLQIGNVTDVEAIKAIANGDGSPVIQFTGIHVSVQKIHDYSQYTLYIYDCIYYSPRNIEILLISSIAGIGTVWKKSSLNFLFMLGVVCIN